MLRENPSNASASKLSFEFLMLYYTLDVGSRKCKANYCCKCAVDAAYLFKYTTNTRIGSVSAQFATGSAELTCMVEVCL